MKPYLLIFSITFLGACGQEQSDSINASRPIIELPSDDELTTEKEPSGAITNPTAETTPNEPSAFLGEIWNIRINNGSSVSNSRHVTLNITVPISAYRMMVSNVASFYGSNWIFPADTMAYSFDGEGYKSIYVKFKDIDGRETPTIAYSSINIDLYTDTNAGVIINSGAAYTNSLFVTLAITVPVDAREMKVSSSFSYIGAIWEPVVENKIFNIGSGEGTRWVYVKFKNDSGIESPSYWDSITVDTVGPTISFNNSNPVNKTASASSGVVNQSCQQIWVSPTGSSYYYKINNGSWIQTATNTPMICALVGTHTVYVKALDSLGNEGNTISRTWTVLPRFYVQSIAGDNVIRDRGPDGGFGSRYWLTDLYSADTRANANAGCANLIYAGYSDWQVPSLDALEGLGQGGIAAFVPTNMNTFIWTSSPGPIPTSPTGIATYNLYTRQTIFVNSMVLGTATNYIRCTRLGN